MLNPTEAVAYPGLATNGKLIYIFERGTLQVYDTETNAVTVYRTNISDLERTGLFYWKHNLYVVGGCRRNGWFIYPSAAVYTVRIDK